ncbi:S-layer homology domain-containing protein [Clostridiales bacterium COT073_COT-073]|nr:S-layer homology domain-containing protein [Clostridiales bacterium COT073_COT-073]
MKKRGLSLLLTLVMVLSVFSGIQVYANDYAGHWAKSSINAALKKGYLNGFPDGTIRPEAGISRAEFVKLINHSLNFTETKEIQFTDVKAGDWFYQEVATGVKAGYINGVSATEFRPNDILTREQAAKIIAAAEGYGKPKGQAAFTDKKEIADWAAEAVDVCVEKGVIKGMPNGSFAPKRQLTRGEAITMVEKTLGATAADPQDVKIARDGQVLKYRTYKNVEITKTLGKGTATLKKARIKGNLVVRGGGRYSVYLEDVIVEGQLIVEKEDGEVRIHVSGESDVAETVLNSGAILEEENIADGHQGLSKVNVSPQVPKGHEVVLKAQAEVSINNKSVKITQNDKVLQTPAVASDTTSDSSSGYVPTPQPEPQPEPQPQPADPEGAPKFTADGSPKIVKHGDKWMLELTTVSAASIYVVTSYYDEDNGITKEQVLRGVTPTGFAGDKFFVQTRDGEPEQIDVTRLSSRAKIYLVATNASVEERLQKPELATNVKKLTFAPEPAGPSGPSDPYRALIDQRDLLRNRMVIYSTIQFSNTDLDSAMFKCKDGNGVLHEIGKAKVIQIPNEAFINKYSDQKSVLVLEREESFPGGDLKIVYTKDENNQKGLKDKNGKWIDSFTEDVIYSDTGFVEYAVSTDQTKAKLFFKGWGVNGFKGEEDYLLGEYKIRPSLFYRFEVVEFDVLAGNKTKFVYHAPANLNPKRIPFNELTAEKISQDSGLLNETFSYLNDIEVDAVEYESTLMARLSKGPEGALRLIFNKRNDTYSLLADSLKIKVRDQAIDPFFVTVKRIRDSGSSTVLEISLIENTPQEYFFTADENYIEVQYDPTYQPIDGRRGDVYLRDRFGEAVPKDKLQIFK